MMLSRRSFFMGATSLALDAARPRHARAVMDRANPLKIPKLIEGTASNAEKLFELFLAEGKSNFLPNHSTTTFGINGAYLGPTVRVRIGDRVTMRVKNDLAEP